MNICPHCRAGKPSVEMFGFSVHQLGDRWITCNQMPIQAIRTESESVKIEPRSQALIEDLEAAEELG
jgi:hypothetical protein